MLEFWDSAGTYRSATLLFKLLVGYSKFSFYQGIVAPGSFGLTGARDGRLVDAQMLVAAHCDSKESFKGHYEQLRVLSLQIIKL